MHIHICIYTYICTHACKNVHIYIHIHIVLHTYMNICLYIYACTCMQAYILAYMDACIQAFMDVHDLPACLPACLPAYESRSTHVYAWKCVFIFPPCLSLSLSLSLSPSLAAGDLPTAMTTSPPEAASDEADASKLMSCAIRRSLMASPAK